MVIYHPIGSRPRRSLHGLLDSMDVDEPGFVDIKECITIRPNVFSDVSRPKSRKSKSTQLLSIIATKVSKFSRFRPRQPGRVDIPK